MKAVKQGIVLLILAGLLGLGWFAVSRLLAKRHTQAVPRGAGVPVKVSAYEVTPLEFKDVIEVLGTVQSAEAIELSAKVTETVEELLFEDGQMVKAGQLLVRLSSAEVEAGIEGARAMLEEQDRESARLSGLVKSGAVPQARLQERETLAEIARRRIQEGEARLADRRIVAPFPGRLGLRRISPGALVSPGTVLVTLDRLDTVKLDFQVPEVFLSDVRSGMRITARSPAWSERVFEGRVSQVDSRVDPVTRSVTVRAELPNDDLALRSGMLMTAQVGRKPRMAAAIPERSVIQFGRRQFVYLLDENTDQILAQRIEVRTGSRVPGYLEITDGLMAGQRIVADGYMGLRDGGQVVIAKTFQGPPAPFNPRVGVGESKEK